MSTHRQLTIGLFGFGVVGEGLYKILQQTPSLKAQIKNTGTSLLYCFNGYFKKTAPGRRQSVRMGFHPMRKSLVQHTARADAKQV